MDIHFCLMSRNSLNITPNSFVLHNLLSQMSIGRLLKRGITFNRITELMCPLPAWIVPEVYFLVYESSHPILAASLLYRLIEALIVSKHSLVPVINDKSSVYESLPRSFFSS